MNIRPFRIAVPAVEILELHRRLDQTRWPSTPADTGWAAGMDMNFLRKLAMYWRTQFDWRRVESALNEVPHFQAESDLGSVHFVHLKSGGEKPLPIVLTHGWPGNFAELLKLGQMLANPAMHGCTSTDAFDVVIPSLPGYTFSPPPRESGMNVFAIAERWAALMSALVPGDRVSVPVAVAHFPRELPIPPRSYVERGYNVVRWTEMRQGGHFAAMEEPEALAEDIRVFARPLRGMPL